MIITIYDLKQEGNFFIVDGIMKEDFIYSFRFIGNNIENILTYKKISIKYDTFFPSSAEFEDVELSAKVIYEIKLNCVKYIANYIENKPKNSIEEIKENEEKIENKYSKNKKMIYYREIENSSFLDAIFYNDLNNLFGIKFSGNDTLYLYKDLEYKDFIEFYKSDRKHKMLSEIKKNCKMIKLEDRKEIKNFFLDFEDIFESYF